MSESSRFTLPAALIHDLRTPINHILGYSEMLIEQTSERSNEDFTPDLQRIQLAGQHLLQVINGSFVSGGGTEVEAAPTLEIVRARTDPVEVSGEHSGSLLVVDDNEGNRDLLARLLQRQGYQVATANSGSQALEALVADAFDLVMLDIMMPEMDGYEVLKRIKADDWSRNIPVIMISAHNELESVARCIELGAEDYLPKPFNQTILRARVNACLEKKRGRDREVVLFKELEQHYKQLQELKTLGDNLTQMIIHDLRTPLTSLITGIRTLEVVGDLNEDQHEMKDIALHGGETLLGLINDLLDVEKLESGAMQLDYDVLHVPELVGTAIEQVSSLLEEKQLKIVEKVSRDLPTLIGDESKLLRTLSNLLGNAIKFTPALGTITVAVCLARGGGAVEFSVTDTGEGIPRESFGQIFEKFGQVESRQSGRVMSTGLGLTFCKLVVEAHGGRIRVKSGLGQGSTFTFAIPLPAA